MASTTAAGKPANLIERQMDMDGARAPVVFAPQRLVTSAPDTLKSTRYWLLEPVALVKIWALIEAPQAKQ